MPTPFLTTVFRAAARLAMVPAFWALVPGDAAAGKILATVYNAAASGFIEIDPLTGDYTELSSYIPISGYPAGYTRTTYDYANNVLYHVNYPNAFSRLDAATGAITLVTVPDFYGLAPTIDAFEFNPVSGKILATVNNAAASGVLEIDPLTGNYTELSSYVPISGYPVDYTRTTYDYTNNVLYHLNFDNSFSRLDAVTAEITLVTVPDFHGLAPTIGGFEFNPATGKIVATMFNAAAGGIVEIDPLTGDFVELSTMVPQSSANQELARTTYDPVNNIMYFVDGAGLFSAVDAATGAVTNITVPNFYGLPAIFDGFEFVPDALQAVPEPGSLGLAALAACLLALPARRRRFTPASPP